MSSGNIKMTWEQMKSASGTCKEQRDIIGAVISKMDSLLVQLRSDWEGAAADAYAERWNGDLKKSFQDAQQLMDDIGTALTKTSEQVQSVDASLANSLRNR